MKLIEKKIKKLFFIILMFVLSVICFISCNTGDYYLNMKCVIDGNINKSSTDSAVQIIKNRLIEYGIHKRNISIICTNNEIIVNIKHINENNIVPIKRLVLKTGYLGFYETYEFKDIYTYLEDANTRFAQILENDSKIDTISLINKLKQDQDTKPLLEDSAKENPLFAYLYPAFEQDMDGKYYFTKGPVVGYCKIIDTARINNILKNEQIKQIFPKDLHFMWEEKPYDDEKSMLKLIAIKVVNDNNAAAINGNMVVNAHLSIDQLNNELVSIELNQEGTAKFKQLTAKNIEKSIAIVIDNYVYTIPVVQSQIPNGQCEIKGNYTKEECQEIITVLKSGKLPVKFRVLDEKSGIER